MASFLVLALINKGQAANFYVSPTGLSTNSGSLASPWDLQTALNHPASVKPGDTIFLRGGTYKKGLTPSTDGYGDFMYKSLLNGTAQAPITVKAYAGEWPVLDGTLLGTGSTVNAFVFVIVGSNAIFNGFEVTNTNPDRPLSFPSRPTGVNIFGTSVSIQNMIIHEHGIGVGFWTQSTNSSVTGCLIYNNGGENREHGIYTQNNTGTKIISGNFIFNNYGYGVHMYGSVATNNYTWDHNIWFNDKLLFGGNGAISNMVINNNYSYATGPKIGYGNPNNTGIQISNNFFSGRLDLSLSKNVTVTNNIFVNDNDSLVSISYDATSQTIPGDYVFSRNTYYKPFNDVGQTFYIPPQFIANSCGYWWFNSSSPGYGYCPSPSSWQKDLKYDLDGQFTSELPSSPNVFLKLNDSNPTQRASVVIYNWAEENSVLIPAQQIASLLSVGDTYELRNVQDYFNDVVRGTYTVAGISVAMAANAHTIATPAGPVSELTTRDNTFPRFGAFVLIKTGIGAPADTQAPTVPTGVQASAASVSQINVSWAASTDNVAVTGYRIYRNNTLVTTVAGTSYNDMGLNSNTLYSYQVAAIDAANNASAQTTAVSTKTLTDTLSPTKPTSVSAVAPSPSQVNVTWSPATDNVGVVSYRVYKNAELIPVATIAAPTCSYSEPVSTPGITLAFRVSAVDANNNVSDYSAITTVTVPKPSVTVTPGNNFYVSPTGSSTNSGTLASPWDLATALSHPSSIKPGDTIWLREGTYVGIFDSALQGTVSKPIRVRNYNNERVILDGNVNGLNTSSQVLSQSRGGYVWYQGLEVTNSNPNRVYTTLYVSAPPDRAGGVSILAPGVKLISMVIHDTSEGISAWIPATDFEAYGNVVYNVGWINPNGGAGHGIYSQNHTTTKFFENNIVGNNFMYTAQLYGKQVDLLDNFVFRKNIFYNPSTILFGGSGSTPLSNIVFDDNYIYDNPLQIGYMNEYNHDVLVSNNTMAFSNGHNPVFRLAKKVTITNNTLMLFDSTNLMLLTLDALPSNVPSDYVIDSNSFYQPYVYPGQSFYIANGETQGICRSLWFNQSSQGYGGSCIPEVAPNELWQEELGFDRNSTLQTTIPTTPKIFFTKKDEYDASRAHIAIFNLGSASNVDIPAATVGTLLSAGDSYELRTGQNYTGDISTGVYNGGNLRVSMLAANHSVALPIGYGQTLGANTFPKFGAFVLIKKNTNTSIQDTQAPTVPTSLQANAISSSQINLRWTASTDNVGVTGYRIYRNATLITTVTGITYSDTGLISNTSYSYQVAAIDAANNSSVQTTAVSTKTRVTTDIQAPSVPTNLQANVVSDSQINLSWTASTDNVGVTGYRVVRNATLITTVIGTSYSDTGLTSNTSYSYQVAAIDAASNASANTASVLATSLVIVSPPPSSPPTTPPTQAETPSVAQRGIFNPLRGEKLALGLYVDPNSTLVEIFSRQGELVYSSSNAGSSSTWDGRNQQGQLVPAGLYLVKSGGLSKKVIVVK